MIRLTFKRRVTLLIIGMGLLLCGVVFGAGLPAIYHILDLEQAVSLTHKQLEEQYTKTRHMRRSVNELGSVEELANKYSQMTIQPGEELDVITKLESLAQQYAILQTLQVDFTDAKPAPGGKPAKVPLPYYSFSFACSGDFEHLFEYLNAIEQLSYYLSIDDMVWEKKKQNTNDTSTAITLRFTGKIFVSKD